MIFGLVVDCWGLQQGRMAELAESFKAQSE